MQPEDANRLRHLTEAATKAATKADAYSSGKQRADLDDDELLRLALTKLVEIVGEAAKHVSSETREVLPDIPWRAAARMRDRLIHHYFDINLDVLWQTVTSDLPQLLAALPTEDSPAAEQTRVATRVDRGAGCGAKSRRRPHLVTTVRAPCSL